MSHFLVTKIEDGTLKGEYVLAVVRDLGRVYILESQA